MIICRIPYYIIKSLVSLFFRIIISTIATKISFPIIQPPSPILTFRKNIIRKLKPDKIFTA